jgi:chromosome partitioning protein
MTHELIELGQYTHMVQTQDKRRAQIGKEPIDWIVMRNRLATLNSRNNQNMELALTGIARRLDLCMVAGFSERVIFRELFLKGLTLLDIRDQGTNVKLTTSHLAALQEVRSVMQAICAVRREPSMVAGSKPVL